MTGFLNLAWGWVRTGGNLAEAVRLMLEREGALTSELSAGPVRITLTCDPTVARNVLVRDADELGKLPYEAYVLGPVMHGGSILLEGEAWAARRQAVAGAFAPELMIRLAGHARAVAAERADRWSGIVNVSHEMRALLNDVITRFFGGGEPLGTMPEDMTADESACRFARLERRLESRVLDPLDVRGHAMRVLGLRDPFRDATSAEPALRARLARAAAHPHAKDEPGCALGRNLTAYDAGRELMTLLAAGATSGHHLAWTCAMLATHGEAQRTARDEAIAAATPHSSSQIGASDDRSWITAVLNETLRLYPPAPLMFRKQRGTREYIVIAVWAMHRHPTFWKDPAAFDPRRWTDMQGTPPAAFMPFGLGPRVCVGRRFAQVLSREALSEILRRRYLEPGPHPLRQPRTQIMTRPHADIFVRATERRGHREPHGVTPAIERTATTASRWQCQR